MVDNPSVHPYVYWPAGHESILEILQRRWCMTSTTATADHPPSPHAQGPHNNNNNTTTIAYYETSTAMSSNTNNNTNNNLNDTTVICELVVDIAAIPMPTLEPAAPSALPKTAIVAATVTPIAKHTGQMKFKDQGICALKEFFLQTYLGQCEHNECKLVDHTVPKDLDQNILQMQQFAGMSCMEIVHTQACKGLFHPTPNAGTVTREVIKGGEKVSTTVSKPKYSVSPSH